MNLVSFLATERSIILDRWFESILESYPSDTSNFMKTRKDRFTNPVGSTILESIRNIYDELLGGNDHEKICSFLDNIIRIRAVQDLTPSQACSFVFSLKGIIRDKLRRTEAGVFPSDEVQEFEDRIDRLGLLCFDIFVKCREKLYDVKANELRKMTFRLIQRANRLGEAQEETEPSSSNFDNENEKEVTK